MRRRMWSDSDEKCCANVQPQKLYLMIYGYIVSLRIFTHMSVNNRIVGRLQVGKKECKKV